MKRRISLIVLIFFSTAFALYSQEKPKDFGFGGKDGIYFVRGKGMSFHGKRMSLEHDVFFVTSIDVHTKKILIHFNIPVDPRTFTAEAITINEKRISEETEFRFNKAGEFVEITLHTPITEQSTLELKGVTAFDGTPLAMKTFNGLVNGCRFMYKKPEKK